ncbi:MAG: spore coat protein [Methylococcales symbiont of Iophon sp. n. MRB-2018]|nr:MAG: spore coat protein [Methylococcales symbiont of Iophon sp. n. MRB-2018]KAF3980415.1 MAG: spore coat protein [Methylococcales symbiont of Iophon sp. n. MRB-2018]
MILAILQARTSSSRLPNKVLKKILGKEMILHQINRIQHSKLIDKIVVATSDNAEDMAIVELCKQHNIDVFTGDLDNVLDRFYQCSIKFKPEHIVRLTADCPVADYQVIDKVVEYYLNGKYDYCGTAETFPDGLDVEIFSLKSLINTWENATLTSEKEHVTYYINQNSGNFKIGYLENNQDLSTMRWTVDEPEDFILIEEIYKNLYPKNPNFLMADILNLLKQQPVLATINSQFKRNEGLQKSLARE